MVSCLFLLLAGRLERCVEDGLHDDLIPPRVDDFFEKKAVLNPIVELLDDVRQHLAHLVLVVGLLMALHLHRLHPVNRPYLLHSLSPQRRV